MNTVVPERDIPSHQGPDAQSVDPDLDIVTMAVKIPETLAHLHLWEDMLTVQGDELFYAYMVDNQAIVIPETIDAIRALTGIESDADLSISKTNASLGISALHL